jgi:L-threonylcarbamoyladenylate synthase
MSLAKILSPTPENIRYAAESLGRGEVGGMPTETVYGLAGDGLNAGALTRIFETKARPTFDPLILHVSSRLLGALTLAALRDQGLVDDSSVTPHARAQLERLMAAFWPGPLTLVLPKQSPVPDLATSGLPSVALRMPRHPVAQALIDAAERPLAAPSANRFGRISPTRARHVVDELGGKIGWVLDGGPCEIGVESTIVGFAAASGEFSLLRPGGISAAEIEAVLKATLSTPRRSGEALPAPGMLESHYAPSKPLTLLPSALSEMSDEQLAKALRPAAGILAFSGDPQKISARLARIAGGTVVVRCLSRDGDLAEAAHQLFSELRALDASSAEILFAEPVPSHEGLGFAIQDRLRRASAKNI